jgi:hypothetical protein
MAQIVSAEPGQALSEIGNKRQQKRFSVSRIGKNRKITGQILTYRKRFSAKRCLPQALATNGVAGKDQDVKPPAS